MIAVDASALLAILLLEPEGGRFRDILERRGGVISPVNYWEVLSRSYRAGGEAAVARAEGVIEGLGLTVGTVTLRDARSAHTAFRRFGKGVGGKLNLGDCFAYALAATEDEGLLFKGDDFAATDVAPVAI